MPSNGPLGKKRTSNRTETRCRRHGWGMYAFLVHHQFCARSMLFNVDFVFKPRAKQPQSGHLRPVSPTEQPNKNIPVSTYVAAIVPLAPRVASNKRSLSIQTTMVVAASCTLARGANVRCSVAGRTLIASHQRQTLPPSDPPRTHTTQPLPPQHRLCTPSPCNTRRA